MQSQLVSELERLQQLHTSGFLTDTELAQAKAKLLAATSSEPLTVEEADAMLERVDRAEHKAELAELKNALLRMEQDWQETRKQYLTKSQQGQYIEPTRAGAVGSTIALVIVGGLSMAIAVVPRNGPRETSGLQAVIGVVGFALILAAIFTAADAFAKVEALTSADAAHQAERAELLRKIAEHERRK